MDGLSGKLCIAMAENLLNDEGFQAESMDMVEDGEAGC
jgi:hypothetical protein